MSTPPRPARPARPRATLNLVHHHRPMSLMDELRNRVQDRHSSSLEAIREAMTEFGIRHAAELLSSRCSVEDARNSLAVWHEKMKNLDAEDVALWTRARFPVSRALEKEAALRSLEAMRRLQDTDGKAQDVLSKMEWALRRVEELEGDLELNSHLEIDWEPFKHTFQTKLDESIAALRAEAEELRTKTMQESSGARAIIVRKQAEKRLQILERVLRKYRKGGPKSDVASVSKLVAEDEIWIRRGRAFLQSIREGGFSLFPDDPEKHDSSSSSPSPEHDLVNYLDPKMDATPLRVACSVNKPSIIEQLLSRGADPFLEHLDHSTPFAHAAASNTSEPLSLLLRYSIAKFGREQTVDQINSLRVDPILIAASRPSHPSASRLLYTFFSNGCGGHNYSAYFRRWALTLPPTPSTEPPPSSLHPVMPYYNSEKFADCRVIRVDEENVECGSVPAHRVILAAASPVWRLALEENDQDTIRVHARDEGMLETLLKFAYGQDANELARTLPEFVIRDMLELADSVGLQGLEVALAHRAVDVMKPSEAVDYFTFFDRTRNALLRQITIQYIVKHLDEVIEETTFADDEPTIEEEEYPPRSLLHLWPTLRKFLQDS